MQISECKQLLKVGDWVKTNADLNTNFPDWLEGEVGEIQDDRFFIWQNERDGVVGDMAPSKKGYDFSWQVNFDNTSEIEILHSASSETDSGFIIDILDFLRELFQSRKKEPREEREEGFDFATTSRNHRDRDI